MTRFASCYFCGTALEGSVSEQPVVPDDLAPDGEASRTVTLCPDCSRKLDAVMDEVRAAVWTGDDAGADSGRDGESDAGAAGADGLGVDEDEGIYEDEGIDTDVDIDASAEGFFEEATQPEGAGSREADAGSDDGRETAAGADDEREADASGSQSEQRADRGAAGASRGGKTGADEGGEAGEADGEPESAKQTISALENSKVMRMLENREFPVERQSFQVVAANAYGVTPADVGKVIDMAIDRGLLAEQNGELVRPE